MLDKLLARVAKDGLVAKAPTFPWRREGLTGIVGANGVYVCDIIKYGSYGHHYATVVELIVEAVNAAHAQQEDKCLTTTPQ